MACNAENAGRPPDGPAADVNEGAMTSQPEPRPSDDLRVSEVVVYRNGVGYFAHEGTVRDDHEVTLPVADDDLDDLLASIVVADEAGAAPQVQFPARDPLARTLASYAIDLSDGPGLQEVLTRARGEEVTVQSSEPITGRVLSVDTVPDPRGPQQTFLSLSTGSGLRRIELGQIRGIAFTDPVVQHDLDAALAALAGNRRRDEREVRVRFRGVGERRVQISYVRAMPVWKVAYRLVLGEDGHGDLQGWAIVDNPTSTDLTDVRISLVAGDPMSFITSLSEPRHVFRPRVDVAVTTNVVPESYRFREAAEQAGYADFDQGAHPAAPMAVAAAGGAAMARAAAAKLQPEVETAEVGLNVAYTVAEPVTIPRYTSAMIPILQHRLPVSRLSVYDEGVDARHPMRAVRLRNPDGLRLAAGPVTVYDGAFAGTAQLADLLPETDQLLAYARDVAVSVHREDLPERAKVTASLTQGVLLETTERSQTTRYRVGGPVPADRLVMLRVPVLPQTRQRCPGPDPARERDENLYGVLLRGTDPDRPGDDGSALPVQAEAGPGADAVLPVDTVTEWSRQVSILTAGDGELRHWLRKAELTPEQEEVLGQVTELTARRAKIEQALTEPTRRREAITREQERIRANLTDLDRTSQLYTRYVAELTAQEDELVALREREQALEEEQAALRGPLEALLARLAELSHS